MLKCEKKLLGQKLYGGGELTIVYFDLEQHRQTKFVGTQDLHRMLARQLFFDPILVVISVVLLSLIDEREAEELGQYMVNKSTFPLEHD